MTKNESVFDERFEALLAQAVKLHCELEMEGFPPEDELDGEVVFSKRHQRRMEKLFAKLERKRQRSICHSRFFRILIAAALIAGMLFAGVAAYSYFNPINPFFPTLQSLVSAGTGHAMSGGKWLDYTDRVTLFASVEEMERTLANGAMYPRLSGTEFSVGGVRYSEFRDYTMAEIMIEGDCRVLIYFDGAPYNENEFPAESRTEIGGRASYLFDADGYALAVMMENDTAYVVTAPGRTTVTALVKTLTH